tara:strand:+ start:135 stop:872 length:738 start_codon:yes stop_codon:yes gene_type:complete
MLQNTLHSQFNVQRLSMNFIRPVKTHSCPMCDKTFIRKYTLRRHIDSVHNGEEGSMGDNTDSEGQDDIKRCKTMEDSGSDSSQDIDTEEDQSESESSDTESDGSDSSESDTEDENSSELEDNVTYRNWMEEVKGTTDEMWKIKYKKYIDEDMSESQAKEKADMKTLWSVKKNFFNTFKDFMYSYLHLKDDETYQEIELALEEKMKKGMDARKALNRVMPKYQSKFDGLFQCDEESDEDDQEEDDD